MSTPLTTARREGPGLKEPAGWFAAGERFRKALMKLSDGSLKLFAWICLEADRSTGCYSATQMELARVLGKSRRSMAKYIAELQREDVCDIHPGRNQHSRTIFEIRDEFWPYHRDPCEDHAQLPDPYVSAIKEWFLGLGCTREAFNRADEETALLLKHRGIPLDVVRDALLMGACRKYSSWFTGGPQEPIASLKYFEAVISEINEMKLPAGYREYLEAKIRKWSCQWRESSNPAKLAMEGG